jgi:deazaflavin-dependent oxidoreductase (nitroreductase family)
MTVELTPNGTRGANMPKMSGPIAKVVFRFLVSPITRLMGGKVLTLITVGSKSGRTHEVDLGWWPDTGNRWLIVASNNGSAKHPAWYYNLARNPDNVWIKVDGGKLKVRPESLRGEERETKYNEIVAVAPMYGGYRTKTDREIPVIRLTAAPSSS